MSRRNRVAIAAILVLFCATLFSACGGKQDKPENPGNLTPTTSAEPKQNSYVLKNLPEGVSFESANKYVESVDLYDEDSAGSEYWKVRVCSAEEQAKGNMFETDLFYFGEPKEGEDRYILKIKNGVILPENLYLGWLFTVVEPDGKICKGYLGYYVPAGTFEGCTEIETVSIPEREQTMVEKMFESCINLKTVYLRSWENWWNPRDPQMMGGVKDRDNRFPKKMFKNCTSLTEVLFSSCSPENPGGASVYGEAFMNCSALKHIAFPGFLAYIRSRGGTWNKTRIVFWSQDAFTNCFNFGPADENQVIEYREERS